MKSIDVIGLFGTMHFNHNKINVLLADGKCQQTNHATME